MTILYILLCGLAGAIARRAQGLAAETWALQRTLRMLVVWPAVAALILFGGLLLGAPAWAAVLAAPLPGLYQWLPGRWNSFWLHHLTGIRTEWTEGLSGGVATMAAALIPVLALRFAGGG